MTGIRSIFFIGSIFLLASCMSIKNNIYTSLAGADAKGRVKAVKSSDSMMSVLTGEQDTILMADFFPTALKFYEILLAQNPNHQGMAIRTGSLYVMYANAFVQIPSEFLPLEDLELQVSETKRAKLHYLRGRDYIFSALDRKYPSFSTIMKKGYSDEAQNLITKLTEHDVEAIYWLCAGWLGAFSVDYLDTNILQSILAPVQLLEWLCRTNPSYAQGAAWDLLAAFYAAAPAEFGGNKERALFCSDESIRLSQGLLPGPFVTRTTAFCIPDQDINCFRENLNKALAINPNDSPENRLATVLTQKKAQWLLDHIDDFFIIWE